MAKESANQLIDKANGLYLKGNLKPAQAIIKKILKKNPNDAYALHALALIEYGLGHHDFAITKINQAIALNDNNPDWFKNLAVMYGNARNYQQAARAALQAVELNSDFGDAYCLLGEALFHLKDYPNAITAFAKALEQQPKNIELYLGVAKALDKIGQTDQAISALLQALSIEQNHPAIYGDLGAYYFHIGLVEESITCLKKLVELTPDSAENLSALITTLVYKYDFNDELMADFMLYNVKHCLPLASKIKPHKNIPDPDKQIKIGYISADFYNHSIAFYIEPIISKHDREKFEIYCYYNNSIVDDFTYKIRKHSHHWCECLSMSDEALAEKIRLDGIDILIDLSGHTLGNRLRVFAYKPAPIQITWLGFPTTTGLTTMDYIILNKGTVPEKAQHFFTEEVLLLDKIASFVPPIDAPPVNNLPAIERGVFTFASFNAPFKISDDTILIWSNILRKFPSSRFILYIGKTKSELVKNIFLEKFARNGVDSDRIIFQPPKPLKEYLCAYDNIDLCLDTFPYNGSTTTFLSLWMGAPVVTMRGSSPHSNQAAIILDIIGLKGLVATTEDEYMDIVNRYMENLDQLQQIRFSLRDKIKNSALMENDLITQDIENSYQQAWNKWCIKNSW